MGIPTLIKTLTASGDSSLSFVDGTADVTLDSTYDEYMFVCTDIGPATDATEFQFNMSDDTSSHSYDIIKTTTFFFAEHTEGGSGGAVAYQTSRDLAQATGFQDLCVDVGNGSDESSAGILHLLSPANTTYVKHFYARFNEYHQNNLSGDCHISGYFNTTAALTAIQFKMASGNFDGVIQMYGIS